MTTTDDTRQRSVAELMGWERAADYDEERWVDPIDHVAWLPGSGYDCDDMLEWLLGGRVEVADTHSYERLDGSLEHVVTIGNDDRWTEHRGPTLHAALEAAVRAVAEAD